MCYHYFIVSDKMRIHQKANFIAGFFLVYHEFEHVTDDGPCFFTSRRKRLNIEMSKGLLMHNEDR